MIRTRRAGKKGLVVGLVVAAVVCGSAAAAVIPVYWLSLHARLAPAAGNSAAGQFSGTLLVSVGGTNPAEPSDPLPPVKRSVLTWKLSLPPLRGRGPISASLRLRATTSAAPLVRVLCERCSTTAHGRIMLTKSQGLRVATSDAVVVVTAASATLRGPVKVSARIIASAR
jgi:hypothetical protein